MSEAQPSLGFLLVRLGEAVDRRFVAALAELGLRPRELRALVLIDRHPGGSQRELARRMAADPGNLIAVLDRLERNALITRDVGSADRRRRTLALTRAGEGLLARAIEATRLAEEAVLAPLTEVQRGALETIASEVWRDIRASHDS